MKVLVTASTNTQESVITIIEEDNIFKVMHELFTKYPQHKFHTIKLDVFNNFGVVDVVDVEQTKTIAICDVVGSKDTLTKLESYTSAEVYDKAMKICNKYISINSDNIDYYKSTRKSIAIHKFSTYYNCSIIDVVRYVRDECHISLVEAKTLVEKCVDDIMRDVILNESLK